MKRNADSKTGCRRHRQTERQGKRGRQIVQERRTRKSKPEALHKERESEFVSE